MVVNLKSCVSLEKSSYTLLKIIRLMEKQNILHTVGKYFVRIVFKETLHTCLTKCSSAYN